ncbi:hypothetical protein MUK42_25627 [Musa troglodytarum]|uniref:UV-stimulated scaffold protein A C-terminal domain-containing protein n=1 Tax=Musa troglodytarum TaxID=320322 RepID=A0A9E7KRS1_9LILI|nr:hypothetical protein MUK42_25627 [Musa troglodytarum]
MRGERHEMGREEESDAVAAMVPRLIEKATNSTAPEVNPRLLKAIKFTVQYSDDEVHAAVQSLMVQMKKPHSQNLWKAKRVLPVTTEAPPVDGIDEIAVLQEGQKVQEDNDNKAIFDALRELFKLLISKHLTSVQEWISVLIRVDLNDHKFRDTALKEFIDIRNVIQSVRNRCVQLGCVLNDPPSQEEDIWEEGKIEDYIPQNSVMNRSLDENSVDIPSRHKCKKSAPTEENKLSDSSESVSERSRLLAEAPVLSWGPFLDNWGSKRDVLANQRGLELDGHWGRVDYDAVIPAERIAELSVHRTVYKEEAVEIQPCLAPLRKGGLCQRKDLRVCPFHGPIIPRDALGNPIGRSPCSTGEIEKDSSTEATEHNGENGAEESPNLGKVTVEQLAKQAVKNVRERDREVKMLKRAKLAKVREHNEVVLREAAIASTSYSEASGERRDASHIML